MSISLPSTFLLERYFEKYEFTTKHLLSCSDAEALTMREVLDMADPVTKGKWDSLALGYTEMAGSLELREEVARLHGVEPGQVNIVVPQEGIYMAMHCLVHYLTRLYGAFHAVAVFPAYQSLYENLKTQDCELSYWTARMTDSSWEFDIDELRSLLRDNTRLVVVNFPHNPTGFLPSTSKWAELLELCKERGLFLFSDEMYSLTNNDGTESNPSACAQYDNSISLFGMSKTFCLPGLRLGWICTKNKEVFDMMAHFKDYLTICPAAPSEQLSLITLRNRDVVLQRTLEIVKNNLGLLDEFFSKHADLFEWRRPRAGTTAFVKLQGKLLHVGAGGASGLCDTLVKQKQLLILPAKMYGFDDEYIRVGFGRKSLEESLQVFEEFITEI